MEDAAAKAARHGEAPLREKLRREDLVVTCNYLGVAVTGYTLKLRGPTIIFYHNYFRFKWESFCVFEVMRRRRYLPFPSSPRTLQEIEVTRLSVCVATAVESQLRFPTAVESQTCLSVCVPTAVESQALSGRIKHSESLIYPY